MVSGEWRMVSGDRADAGTKGSRHSPLTIHHSLLTFAFAFFVALSTLPAQAQTQVQMAKIAAHPALWTVHSKNATVYLFGSIHLLPPGLDWRPPALEDALNKAKDVWFELPIETEDGNPLTRQGLLFVLEPAASGKAQRHQRQE